MKSKISVIIATHNRADTISKTLDSLLDQVIEDAFDYELIIINNNSTDNTKDKVLAYESKFLGRLHLLSEKRQGKAFALNTGIAHSKGDIVAFTDDDVILDSNWLLNIWCCYQEHDCDGVGGRILPLYSLDTPQWVKDNHSFITGPLVMYDRGEDTKKYDKAMVEFLGASYSFKREVFDKCGLFRTDIGPGKAVQGEDTEYVKRVFELGRSLYYCGQALVWHPTDVKRMNLGYFAQWYLGLGKYRFLVDEKGRIDQKLVCWFGIPRYLIRDIFQTGLSLCIKLFNRKELLKTWKMLFINIGRASAMRRAYLCSKSV